MKESYTDKLNKDKSAPSRMAEPVVDNYMTRLSQDSAAIFDSMVEDLPPCSYTDEEILDMLQEIEQENLFIPDMLVRKMFA